MVHSLSCRAGLVALVLLQVTLQFQGKLRFQGKLQLQGKLPISKENYYFQWKLLPQRWSRPYYTVLAASRQPVGQFIDDDSLSTSVSSCVMFIALSNSRSPPAAHHTLRPRVTGHTIPDPDAPVYRPRQRAPSTEIQE